MPEWEKVVRGTLRKVFAPCWKKKGKQGVLRGPYWYLAVTPKGKTKLYYLPKKQMAEKVGKAIEEYNKLWEILCKISETNIKLLIEKDMKKGKRRNEKRQTAVDIAGVLCDKSGACRYLTLRNRPGYWQSRIISGTEWRRWKELSLYQWKK